MKPLKFSGQMHVMAQQSKDHGRNSAMEEANLDIDLKEVYFLIMHFLSTGPCHRTYGQFWNELLEHNLLPRRYHAWYSRRGVPSGDEDDDGMSFPLSYNKLVERHPHIEKDHLVSLLKQLLLSKAHGPQGVAGGKVPNAADVPTLLGTGSFSLLSAEENKSDSDTRPPLFMRWPHMQADQVHGLGLREIGGFRRHHRLPAVRAACYAIAKPSMLVQKMQNMKKIRGHRNAVYCAISDRSGRFVITGSDDRLVKIWCMETAYCLASCRGHEGDITDLATSSNNALVASASNDCIIRVWRIPDGLPISVLRGHTGGVTAIAFSPRPSAVYQLLSAADDGTCRLWDARYSQFKPRIFLPKPSENASGKSGAPSSSVAQQNHQIFCCTFNASGTVFVTGSSDFMARVWNACKYGTDDSDQPIHEMDVLSGHENDVNYVQFSGCTVALRSFTTDVKEDNVPKFKNSWFAHDNIVTCSRDGSAIIWIPRSRRSHGRAGRWTRAYHLKVPPPPMPPQPPRGGPRQRVLPTPRGVNMIIWSLDNRFVLAALMDCRICVWNAADGSLVHSLTGHTESTYVLDVHPFNPRIAMSAGYDGKTIVWDIWEGKPIRIYETGRFKLVDGKFSPDGTSIVLSDDVGQLYILSTGQGESQMGAKYDQFFLGDYRPLIQDTHGNVVDQETQLAPYRRNMQDLLCDSSMIPYPEPYQSTYQRRRLRTLGIEWHPSPIRFTVGPDFNSDHDYQIPPLADTDVFIDSLPEFLDVMDWEPEVEIISDDSDSEFNVTEEFSVVGDEVGLCSTSSDDSECSAEDCGGDDEDGLRRSKRKKDYGEIEITTLSGRRVKRRNLDKYDDSSHRILQTKKLRNGRIGARKKSSSLVSSRPRRAAARNALSLFSKINGKSVDEDLSEEHLSESTSTLQEFDSESEDSDRYVSDDQIKNLKGKELIVNDSEDLATPGDYCPPVDAVSRKRLIFKLPIRDKSRVSVLDNFPKHRNESGLVGSSSSALHLNSLADENNSSLRDAQNIGERKFDFSEAYKDGNIKWGGVKARTSKCIRSTEPVSLNGHGGYGDFNEPNEVNMENGCLNPDLPAPSMVENKGVESRQASKENGYHNCASNSEDVNGLKGYNESDELTISRDTSSANDVDGMTNGLSVPELDGGVMLKCLKEMSNRSLSDPCTSSKLIISSTQDQEICKSQSDLKQRSDVENATEDNIDNCAGSVSRDLSGVENTVCATNLNAGSSARETLSLHSQRSDRMYSAVYRRSRGCRTRTFSSADGHGEEKSLSNSNHDHDVNVTMNGSQGDEDLTCTVEQDSGRASVHTTRKSVRASAGAQSFSINRCDQITGEWGTGLTVGLRSTRNRRSNFARESSPVVMDRRRSSQSQKKLSWLLLSIHEGSRYIPQLGDDVVYLRQGHQEYISCSQSSERGPWQYLKGEIRDVEFCKITNLDYSTLPGSGDSCCKMTLEFVDPSSMVCGTTFRLTLPEVTSFPDFLVEKTRYDAAIERNWTARDKCQVWWKNEGEEDGSWWEGRIVAVKAKAPEFPDSPWERYAIRYKSDPGETHYHSPWELHDSGTQWEQPHIDEQTTKKLLSSLTKLEHSGNRSEDIYGLQKLREVSQKTSFLNRFPVPLSLDVIRARLENNYYRSEEAVRHDIKVMLSNAESYFVRSAENSAKMKRLSDWFNRALSCL